MEALESKTYTTEKTLAEQMNERLRELKMTKAEAAMRMNYSRVSQYLNGKYGSDPTEIEKKITEFLIASGGMEGVPETPETTEGTGLKLKSKVEFFESRDFINTIECVKLVRRISDSASLSESPDRARPTHSRSMQASESGIYRVR